MRILIVGLVKNAQLKRVQNEGEKRGHQVDGCYVSELTIHAEKDVFEPKLRNRHFKDYDLIYFWALGARRWEWYLAAEYLNKKEKTIIVNKNTIDPSFNYSTTPILSYLLQVENKLPFPKSTLIFSPNSVDNVITNYEFPVIVKASVSHQGKGVFKAGNKAELIRILKDNKELSHAFIIREFIENDGDIRVFTVGYRAIGAMKRIPPKGDFRSNISVGGKGEIFELEKYPKVKELAEKAAEVTKTEIAGVDVILDKNSGDPYILEVNPGPQFTGLEKYTQTNAALEIVKYFESLYNKRK